jgi:hypothetical protein
VGRTVDDLLLSEETKDVDTRPAGHRTMIMLPLLKQTSDNAKSLGTLTVRGAVASTEQSSTYLCLTFTEQQLHSDLDKLRLCNELKLNSGSITSPQDPLRIVHRYDTNSLADSLELMRTTVGIRKYYSLRNEAWPMRILHQHGPREQQAIKHTW